MFYILILTCCCKTKQRNIEIRSLISLFKIKTTQSTTPTKKVYRESGDGGGRVVWCWCFVTVRNNARCDLMCFFVFSFSIFLLFSFFSSFFYFCCILIFFSSFHSSAVEWSGVISFQTRQTFDVCDSPWPGCFFFVGGV